MEAKDKAKELFDKFYDRIEDIKIDCNMYCYGGNISKKEPSKQCALIAVDELIESLGSSTSPVNLSKIDFYQMVRIEIEKL